MDKLKGWKTLLFNAGVAVLGVAQAFDWTSVLGATPYSGWVVTGIGVVGMILRSVTTTPVGVK